MAEFFSQYWYALVAIVVGVWAILILLMLARPGGTERHRLMGLMMLGPFWPFVGGYLSRRGGLSRREWIGWAVVIVVMVLAAVFGPRRGA